MIRIKTTIPPARIPLEYFSHSKEHGPLTYLECIPDGSDEGIPGEMKFLDQHLYQVDLAQEEVAKLKEMGFTEFEVF